jgi:ketosteroid isomerase-like protein
MRRAPSNARTGLIGLVVIPILLAGCGAAAAPTASQVAEMKQKADIYDIEQIEVAWHKAASTQNLDLMMSLWADNATFLIGGQVISGKEKIRNFFATKAAPFQQGNQWVSDTPAYKMQVTVNGDKGTLYFECHYIDPATKQAKSIVAANQDVERINGKWLITGSTSATAVLGT